MRAPQVVIDVGMSRRAGVSFFITPQNSRSRPSAPLGAVFWGDVGSSLQAELEIKAPDESYKILISFEDDLKFIFIASKVSVIRSSGSLEIIVNKSAHKKCERCWHYKKDIGSNESYSDICERCISNLSGPGEIRNHA